MISFPIDRKRKTVHSNQNNLFIHRQIAFINIYEMAWMFGTCINNYIVNIYLWYIYTWHCIHWLLPAYPSVHQAFQAKESSFDFQVSEENVLFSLYFFNLLFIKWKFTVQFQTLNRQTRMVHRISYHLRKATHLKYLTATKQVENGGEPGLWLTILLDMFLQNIWRFVYMVVYFVTDLALPLAVIKGILKLILVIFCISWKLAIGSMIMNDIYETLTQVLYARLQTGRIMWLGMAGVHRGFRTITLVLYIESLPNLATWFPCVRERTQLFWGH